MNVTFRSVAFRKAGKTIGTSLSTVLISWTCPSEMFLTATSDTFQNIEFCIVMLTKVTLRPVVFTKDTLLKVTLLKVTLRMVEFTSIKGTFWRVALIARTREEFEKVVFTKTTLTQVLFTKEEFK